MLSKAASSTIFECLVWLDLGLNPGLPDYWQTLNRYQKGQKAVTLNLDLCVYWYIQRYICIPIVNPQQYTYAHIHIHLTLYTTTSTVHSITGYEHPQNTSKTFYRFSAPFIYCLFIKQYVHILFVDTCSCILINNFWIFIIYVSKVLESVNELFLSFFLFFQC